MASGWAASIGLPLLNYVAVGILAGSAYIYGGLLRDGHEPAQSLMYQSSVCLMLSVRHHQLSH